jgi:hypothetical protein
VWSGITLLEHVVAQQRLGYHICDIMTEDATMTWDRISVRMIQDATTTLDHISATTIYVIWREEHLWNATVLRREHLSSLVPKRNFLLYSSQTVCSHFLILEEDTF